MERNAVRLTVNKKVLPYFEACVADQSAHHVPVCKARATRQTEDSIILANVDGSLR